jgi:MFS family permease
MALLFAMAFGQTALSVIPAFIGMLVFASILGLNIDTFLEDETATRNTGGTRGIFLTAVNAAWVISPLLTGLLLDGTTNYRFVYISALILTVPFAYLIRKNFSNFKDPHYSHATVKATAHKVFHSHDLKKIFIANLILQSFYAWMVIYTPVYLYKYIGFGWDDIGLMFTIMLLPFILVDYPLGKLADKKYGETEIMSIGFLILGLSTITLAYINNNNIFLWTGILFLTRVGAASVEMMIETYFFKKVPEKDLDVLGFFRITRPAAYIIAPSIATLALGILGHQAMFIVLGVMCLCGLYFSLTIRDTN